MYHIFLPYLVLLIHLPYFYLTPITLNRLNSIRPHHTFSVRKGWIIQRTLCPQLSTDSVQPLCPQVSGHIQTYLFTSIRSYRSLSVYKYQVIPKPFCFQVSGHTEAILFSSIRSYQQFFCLQVSGDSGHTEAIVVKYTLVVFPRIH